jgi:hypothetical protein
VPTTQNKVKEHASLTLFCIALVDFDPNPMVGRYVSPKGEVF